MIRKWGLFIIPCVVFSLFAALCFLGRNYGLARMAERRGLASTGNAIATNYWNSNKAWFHTPGKDSQYLRSQATIQNNVSFVYVVGVEGSGVNIVTPAVAIIAKTCNQHVIFRDLGMRGSHMRAKGSSYQYFLQNAKKTKYDKSNVVIFDDAVFPGDKALQQSSPLELKSLIRYNIEWVYDQICATEARPKFLFLSRDFYQTVAAHVPPPPPPLSQQQQQQQQNESEIDASFQHRVDIIRNFILYIGAEHNRIEEKQKGLWRQVQFEWFVDPSKCSGLVAALVDFLGFEVCDVKYACELLRTSIEPPARRNINEINNRYASNMSVTLPIPMLDITERRSYSFTNRKSDRKPFKIAFNETYRTTLPPRKTSSLEKYQNFSAGAVRNKVSLLYIVGVEGVGHHGVTPAIASIAKTCNYHVLYENSVLRRAQAKQLSRSYQSLVNGFKYFDLSFSTNSSKSNVIIIEDQSFPTDGEKRNSSAVEKKSSGKYNLEWVYDQALMANVGINFIHLRRDFYRAVASHPEFDKGFETHAHVLHDFIWYIYSEYEAIERKQKGLWAQVHYEWFTDMANCTALVSAVIEHLHFDHCDVEFACHMLNSTLRQARKREVNSTEFAFAQSFATDLPIPTLDISPKDSYKFSTVVSARKPFTFHRNVTARTRRPTVRTNYTTATTTAASLLKRYHGADRTLHNNVSLLYITGLAGAGQEVIVPLIAHTARACRYHVISENRLLQRAHQKLLSRTFDSVLRSFQLSFYPTTNKVLMVESSPFPTVKEHFNGMDTHLQGMYNLAWVWARAQEVGANMTILHLQRDLQSMLSAVPLSAEGLGELSVERYLEVLVQFNKHIQQEYQRIESKQAGLWAQLKYEWFTQAATSNRTNPTAGADAIAGNGPVGSDYCTALLTAIAHHAGWEDCDLQTACRYIASANFTSSDISAAVIRPKFSEREKNLINSTNISLPIPTLL